MGAWGTGWGTGYGRSAITAPARRRRSASCPRASRPAATNTTGWATGACFFQDAPLRAWEWARQRFGDNAAVVGAEIDLADCIDLLDIPWERFIVRAFERYTEHLSDSGLPVPRQSRGAHRLDRGVLNYFVDRMARNGMPVRSLRAVFPEGEPMYPGSALLTRAHVQIAVRSPMAIVRTWREETEATHA